MIRSRSAECRTGRSKANESELTAMRERAWREQGVLMINPKTQDGLAWQEREWLDQIGQRIFGKGGKRDASR